MSTSIRLPLRPILSAAFLFAASSALATPLFWDDNGSLPGTTTTPNGVWGVDSFWNTDSSGGAGTFSSTTTSADDLSISAGDSATGTYSVTVNGSRTARSLTIQSGTTTLAGTSSPLLNLGSDSNAGILVLGTVDGPFTMANSLGTVRLSGLGTSITRDWSNRGIFDFNAHNAVVGNNSTGTHTLRFNANLSGTNNRFTGGIGNGSAGGATGFTKTGPADVTISGANSLTGPLTMSNGELILDYTATADGTTSNAVLTAGTNPLVFNGGTLRMLGKSGSGNTTGQSFGNITVNANIASTLIVDRNGGDGANLVLGNTWTRNAGGSVHIDLTSGSTLSSSPTMTDSVVVGSGSVAAFTVQDGDGFGFATRSGGNIIKMLPSVFLPTSGGSSTENYLMNTSTALSGAVNTGTLTISTQNAPVILDLEANSLALGKAAVLVHGANNLTINGSTGTLGTAAHYIHHHGTGILTMNARLPNVTINKTGAGLMVLTNTGNSALTSASMSLYEGVVRLGASNTLGGGNLRIAGGILELGAAQTFTRSLGTGSNSVAFWSNGGFSAHGGARVVAIGGTGSPTTLTWGGTNFLGANNRLILGSPVSDNTLDFRNPLDLTGLTREVYVHDGIVTNNVDGLLSGVLSGVGGGLYKSGQGTLSLTNSSTFTGITAVNEGRLLVGTAIGSTASIASSSRVTVAEGATLGGHGTIGPRATVEGVLAPGSSAGSLEFAGDLSLPASSTTEIELGGTAFTFNSIEEYDRVKLTGANVTLTLAGALDVSLINSFALAPGLSFGIFQLASSATLVGSFEDLPSDGSLVGNFGGENLLITYSADFDDTGIVSLFGGNDIALYTIPEPTPIGLLTFACVLFFLRRRR